MSYTVKTYGGPHRGGMVGRRRNGANLLEVLQCFLPAKTGRGSKNTGGKWWKVWYNGKGGNRKFSLKNFTTREGTNERK